MTRRAAYHPPLDPYLDDRPDKAERRMRAFRDAGDDLFGDLTDLTDFPRITMESPFRRGPKNHSFRDFKVTQQPARSSKRPRGSRQEEDC